MDRRTLLKLSTFAGAFLPVGGCTATLPRTDQTAAQVMTVRGLMSARDMGWTLPHEHVFLDERPLHVQNAEPLVPDYADISDVVLPHLRDIKAAGVKTLIETTAVGFGRSPDIVKQLSEDSDLNIIMATGVYLAAGDDYVPEYTYTDSAEQLAARWIDEFKNGTDGNGIRPGMLKLGLKGGELSELDQKVIKAAALAHRETGLVIGVHIGPWGAFEPGSLAQAALETVEHLVSANVSPSAFIWIHAQNEKDLGPALRLADMGANASFDGYRPGQEAAYAEYAARFKDAGHLSRLHLSQDAGWYTLSHENGGTFSPMTPIITTLLPYLRNTGLTQRDIETIFIDNPAAAFQIAKRAI